MTRDELERRRALAELHRRRPRSALLRASLASMVVGVLAAWTVGGIDMADLFSARRRGMLGDFLSHDAVPFPLRERGWSWSALRDWLLPLVEERAWPGALATLWIAVVAIVLAAGLALCLAPLGARSLATREPYQVQRGAGSTTSARWRLLSAGTRALDVALRAIPEYVWAFLLLAVFGPGVWPAVLALAIHNAGILGRLGSETIENLPPAPLDALRTLGAGRRQLALAIVPPLASGRFLLYLFYRFETCVREATVLGMLGVVSLGYWIQDARARHFHDELLLLVGSGAVIVVFADMLSQLARSWVRGAR